MVKPYACPADARLGSSLSDGAGYEAAYASYLAVTDRPARATAMSGDYRSRGSRLLEVTDGTSHTKSG